MVQDFSAARKFEKINGIIEKNGKSQSSLIPILQAIQAEYRYLPEEILTYVSTALGLPTATVFGVATFYAQFSLEPKGKYVVRCCDGTACHVRGSMPVYNAIRKKVDLKDGKFTTPDLRFTVETVACLGACGLAPVLMVNDKVYGQMTEEAAEAIIDALLKEEGLA
ncbi:MAG TPA: NAD(P)H-dependent oxidoreductase subunit E [Bacillota bacterium]|nr:NAD(P)H-dependent oxidoreductase subunit E [Bacillota bacterium]HOA14886.1 NAD(P)H-dependent oxidoreductase subunit E [Bacillota bacterium]HOG53191.1 NAD(P)H-dependent oxidoreductase subunit E [Bacillota bacterium]